MVPERIYFKEPTAATVQQGVMDLDNMQKDRLSLSGDCGIRLGAVNTIIVRLYTLYVGGGC